MRPRLLLTILAVLALLGVIVWAETESWRKLAALEQRLRQPEWAALAEETRSILQGFRGWLVASTVGVLVLAAVLARAVQRDIVAPLERALVATHAVLARQEKLAALGVLAAGVAHEIRNPLTAIKARLFSQRKRLPAGSPEAHDGELIKAEIDRLEQIVKDFLLFARPGEPKCETLPAVDLLTQVGELLLPELQARSTALEIAGEAALRVQVDPAQIRQVLVNLIRNAAESLGQGGTITLRARGTYLPFARQRTAAVALEVEDDGPGVSREVERRLFDPFFTTKATGTGLGLAIAERITEKHGGTLLYQARSPQGAIFALVLPAAIPLSADTPA